CHDNFQQRESSGQRRKPTYEFHDLSPLITSTLPLSGSNRTEYAVAFRPPDKPISPPRLLPFGKKINCRTLFSRVSPPSTWENFTSHFRLTSPSPPTKYPLSTPLSTPSLSL